MRRVSGGIQISPCQREQMALWRPLSVPVRLSPKQRSVWPTSLRRDQRPRLSTSARIRANYWDTFHLRESKPERAPPTDRITSSQLASLKVPPTNVRILASDFIHDSLYNPHYGYFSKMRKVIFSPPEPINFNNLRDGYAFLNYLAGLYKDVDNGSAVDDTIRQVWHTPTELFRPWYGYAVANYLVREFKKDPRDAAHLDIFEIGGGNGTLMLNILDFIRKEHPDIYAITRYTIIEISASLSALQRAKRIHGHKNVTFINKSFFDWSSEVADSCFIIAMEVVDNFAHDVVRYDYTTGVPRQAIVLVDEDGDYQEAYEPVTEPKIERYLQLRRELNVPNRVLQPASIRSLRRTIPFYPNMTKRDFLPTRLVEMLDLLSLYFPRHRLVLSDFDKLPDAVEGELGPVVQTRYKGDMVACSTYLVQPGWFDIFFPTNFEILQKLHAHIVSQHRQNVLQKSSLGRVVSQRAFLEQYANLDATRTRSGEIPMLGFYSNFKFFLT
ncbi:S-adenosyl-L-methionine-dependent methyltransferase [Zopfochytrium polystomum]|nr:S-adenosyl-L-methionine-dependent methyltransferase [Zopfochytrium polystomum]